MKVKLLRDILSHYPQDADVMKGYDGMLREIEHTWLAKNGLVILASDDDYTTEPEEMPVTATQKEIEKGFWCYEHKTAVTAVNKNEE